MALSVRRIDANDEASLAHIAQNENAFDVDGRSEPQEPLAGEEARAFLADPNVLFWIAQDAGQIVGFLSCQLIRRRAASPELLLYEIGVLSRQRRRGIGRALMTAMASWMEEHSVNEVWVLADNDDAVQFYLACGFAVAYEPAIYMTRMNTRPGY